MTAGAAGASPTPVGIDPDSVVGTTWAALGTTVGVWCTVPRDLEALAAAVREHIAAVDAACSRFRADSALTAVNLAAGSPVEVPTLLLDATAAAVRMAEWTGGWCDPTAGGAVVAAGYDRDFADVLLEGPGPLLPPEPAGRWAEIAIDRSARTVTVPAGVRLDLGATAKGWAVDRILPALSRRVTGGGGVCVALGGDLGVVGRPPSGGWPVHLADRVDDDPSAWTASLALPSGAVATSGPARRRWRIGELEAHHLVDPRTGRPAASPWRSVSVVAPGCLLAEAAATTAWLLGADGPDWLSERGLAAHLVRHDGAATVVGALPLAVRA